jgi:hypothetical protein
LPTGCAGEEVVIRVPTEDARCGEFEGSLSEWYDPGSAALGSLLGVAFGVRAGDADPREGVPPEISGAESAKLRPAQAGQTEELRDAR